MPPMTSDHELSKADLLRVVDAVREMSHATSSGDHHEMLVLALRVAIRVTESDGAVVYRLNEAGDELTRVVSEPHYDQLQDSFGRMRVDRTWTGKSTSRARASATPVANLPPAAQQVLLAVGFVHVATVPLYVRGLPIGTVNLSRRRDEPYTQRELRITEILSDLLVVHVENARLFADANARLDEMRMLLEVARSVTASHSLAERLETSADILARMLGASNAIIALVEDEEDVLRGVASANAELRDFVRTIRIPIAATSAAARAVRTMKTVLVADVEHSSEARSDLVQRFGQKSLVALPLIAHGNAIGVVVIDDTHGARVWEAAEIQRGELIAVQVATAVANARLFEKVKQSYEQLALAQEELVKQEKLAALGQLAATLAHEVRNPLGVLFNSLGTLTKLLPRTGDVALLLSIMGEESRRLDRLMRDLLDFARPVRPSIEPHSLAEEIDGALRAAVQQLGPDCASFSSEVPSDLPRISFDQAMMRQALVNLLTNGAQAAGVGGSVVIRVAIESGKRGPLARIEVSDTGPGIPSDLAERVFEPFFTTKAMGTGLGLSIVKSIIEAHGGWIEFTSDTATGTCARLRLPLERRGGP
ncbi:MAG: hypothetical protein BGO98_32565 [Myxococcales bacterium 68-20]|nr:MAG: hypothetical protein BGO98_32565 [Myxococcales bacterium 68-20]